MAQWTLQRKADDAPEESFEAMIERTLAKQAKRRDANLAAMKAALAAVQARKGDITAAEENNRRDARGG